MKIALSSGHGKYIRGASGLLDEVDEARRIVDRVAVLLKEAGVEIMTFHDDTSKDQSTNLNTIVNWHNNQKRDLDVSCHLNAYQETSKPMGCEVLYVSSAGGEVAKTVVDAICTASGFINRGAKKRTDLKFLNSCDEVSVLLEICFVDSSADEEIYEAHFDDICQAIAESLSGKTIVPGPTPPPWEETEPPEDEFPTIKKGDTGPAVGKVQTILGIFPVDADFGSITDGGVKGFQAACSLSADGVVGPKTWEALEGLKDRKLKGGTGLSYIQTRKIIALCDDSAISGYNWRDRGMMQIGYYQGLCLSFGLAVQLLRHGEPAIQRMARKDTGKPDKDALSWYASKFENLGMDNSKNGVTTLRHLFALMMGLGPRESSGRYCEGRDMSASNVSADTAEASLFQTSWNIRSCDDCIEPLLEDFWQNPNGFLEQFQVGAKLKADDLGNFGSGDGARYQFLSKYAPCFHVFVTALGLRSLRQHWGPINRNEVELREDADELLSQVQAVVNRSEETA